MKTLTWKVDKTIQTQCPDYVPDPYTGEYPTTHCLVYHCKTVTEEKTAEFENEQNAKEFAEKAPNSCYDFILNGKILEDKRKKIVISNITSGDLINTTAGGTTTINLNN